jgi:hypothetical protein
MANIDSRKLTQLLVFMQPAFPKECSPSYRYTHIGALLADVSLQAATNYSHIVWPRVSRILSCFPDCSDTETVVRHLHSVGTETFLNWRGQQKVRLFEDILSLLVEQSLNSIEDVSRWVATEGARARLLLLSNVGNKTIDYFRMLCGEAVVPLDRHVFRFVEMAGVDLRKHDYDSVQALIVESCGQAGVPPHVAERGIWQLMRTCT